MKKSIHFFTIIFLLASLSINAGIKIEEDHKVDIWGDLASEDRTKSTTGDAIEIFQSLSGLDLYFYDNANFKVDVYTQAGALLYTKTVNKYRGQILSINTQGWNAGNYKIVMTNLSYKKTASGQIKI